MSVLSIYVNGQVVFEYDREMTLVDEQMVFLDKMDSDMDRGIKIQGEALKNPDGRQKATFVAMNLIRALQQVNEAAMSVSCAYLVSRLPGLVEVHANDEDGKVTIELVEEALN